MLNIITLSSVHHCGHWGSPSPLAFLLEKKHGWAVALETIKDKNTNVNTCDFDTEINSSLAPSTKQ